MIDRQRRTVLKSTVAGGVIAGIAGIGLWSPNRLMAAETRDPFTMTTFQDALNALFRKDPSAGDVSLAGTETDAISFEGTQAAPASANAAPISIASNVPDTESISILVEKNPRPALARFRFGPGGIPQVQVRAKLRETSNVHAVVRDAGGRLHTRTMRVTVTESGCAA